MKVRKRDKTLQEFDSNKIKQAIIKANDDTLEEYQIWVGDIDEMVNEVVSELTSGLPVDTKHEINKDWVIDIEEIQDKVELVLARNGYYQLSKNYIKHRFKRELIRKFNKRDESILSLIQGSNDELKTENSNKDTKLLSTMRDYIAGETCKDIATRLILPKDIVTAHEQGIIHYHDTDFSPTLPQHNCGLVNLEDMLQNGTVISGIMIEKPHSFRTACTIVTQIIMQVASNQYGGNSFSLAHLAPFVDVSRQRIKKEVQKEFKNNNLVFEDNTILNNIVEDRLKQEISDGIQTIQYQLITMSCAQGQAPFTTMFMYLGETKSEQEKHDLALLIEEVLKQRIEGVKNEQGVPITTAFPKLIYVLEEDNIHEDSKYWYLTKLAAECSSKRLVPDYISEKKMKEHKEGHCFPIMGCRSILPPYYDKDGKAKFYGRWNQGVVTINLPDVALSSGGDLDKFWTILNERLELCYKALMTRHNSLKGTKASVAPLLWCYGCYARLKPEDTIDEMLFNSYSSISLGYAGLYECVKYMTGESHTKSIGYDLAIEIMKKLNEACDKWKSETNIGFSVYGTPIESTTYKFAKCLRKRFGVVEGITDKKYITNSYHVNVKEPIDAFSKLTFESKLQELSLGGAISYVETPNLEKNVDAILEVLKHIYENNIYAEVNTTTSYCHICGCTDIKMEDDLKYHCPQCGNDDFDKMNIAVRVCGYISTNPFNEGRAQDIHDRVFHLGME